MDVDEELFKRFAKKCIDVGKTKMDVLRELIRKWVEENHCPPTGRSGRTDQGRSTWADRSQAKRIPKSAGYSPPIWLGGIPTRRIGSGNGAEGY